ncbi:MAG TPA: NRDE family protein [Gammaproteobacteria bacterium]|nr:NRDE family protein [Gammaproteobacteria bacterium]
MCLLVLAWNAHPDYALVLAANRDEFHARPSTAADWWPDAPHVLAGRDLEAGGTWLGVTRRGRFAVVTNIRETGTPRRGLCSRGALAADFLRTEPDIHAYLATLAATATDYGGYNLVFGDRSVLHYHANRGAPSRTLAPGIYGLANATLDESWPKVARVRARFTTLLSNAFDEEALLALLDDTTPAPDDTLPDTGLEPALERRLSAPKVVTETYGTRCSTVVLWWRDGEARFVERSFDPGGRETGRRRFVFRLEDAA